MAKSKMVQFFWLTYGRYVSQRGSCETALGLRRWLFWPIKVSS